MSYTKNVSAGKKVTVNVAEISPVGSTDGYFGNSLVVNPMPAQNITRDILLNVLKFDVHLNVVYGNNTVNPGQSVSAYKAYIQPDDSTPGQRIEINGTRRMFINFENSVCPDFTLYDRKLYFLIGTPDYTICDVRQDSLSPTPTIVKFTNVNNKFTIENPSPSQNIINITIPLYKRLLCDVYYKYDDNGVETYVNCTRAYCSELNDEPTYNVQSAANRGWLWLAKGYTYTFEFEVNGSTITKSYYVNPNLDEKVLIHFEY